MFGFFNFENKHLRRIWAAAKFSGNSAAADDKANSWNLLFERYEIDFKDPNLHPKKLEPLIEIIIKFDERNSRNGGIILTAEFLSELRMQSAFFTDERRELFSDHFQNYFPGR